jgi:hypothetical protein
MFALVRHSYCVSPLAIAGLGFATGFTAATDFGAVFDGVFFCAAEAVPGLAFVLALLLLLVC